MASKDHIIISGSPNPFNEMVKHIMIDIKNEPPEDLNTTKWNIYKVPCNLRSLNESAYTPQLISIGPLHYGQEKLKQMQKQKIQYLNLFHRRVKNNMDQMEYLQWEEGLLSLSPPNYKDTDKEKLVEGMLAKFKEYLESKEADIRQCYAEKLSDDIDKEKLVEMMLLDSVFIMELFLRFQRQKSEEEDRKNGKKQTYSNDIAKQPWVNGSIQRDLILVENQIPLFILEELYNTVVPNSDPDKRRPTFIELAQDYFDCYHTYKKADSYLGRETSASSSSPRFMKLKEDGGNNYEPQHFTDLIRSFYACKGVNCFKKRSPLETATKLQEVGVSFEKVDNRPLLDIKVRLSKICSRFLCLGCMPNFEIVGARFVIPQLRIDHTTECVLSNIMALEQCHYPDQPYVCSYVSLFDSLIHTKEDVSLLVEKEVIAHTLRSDTEVETLVHDLGRNVVTNETCYTDITRKLAKYYNRMWWRIWWNRSMVKLRLVYFRDLWRASSVIIGLFILMFTILNGYKTIRDFYVVKN